MFSAMISLAAIGLVAAIALGLAAKRFAVAVDPREQAIFEALPGANCGACGFPGCAGYARALARGEAAPDQCPPGGAAVVAAIGGVLGIEVSAAEPQVAVVLCQGDNRKAAVKYRYLGLTDCTAAQRIADGPKQCGGGCLGLGSCERACPFGAIEMTADGLAVIDRERCTGCRKCVPVCPRRVIRMTPRASTVHVLCNSHDPGAVVHKYCTVGCIACQLCVKAVPDAYRIEERLAAVVYGQDAEAAAALARCPTKCIRDFATGYPEGSRFTAPQQGAA